MAAYVLAEIEVTNPEGYKEYTSHVPPAIAKYRGRFLVRGGACETLEGQWPQKRRVLIEFRSMEAAWVSGFSSVSSIIARPNRARA